ncbi:hypothetical protein BDR07DRAFT_1441770 [Suillus spraguei]|nr:hypothetical protein BDR07DRAFT_1441770 [Suillus spraguei]
MQFRCLRSLNASTCLFCRKKFNPDCVKKLHVGNPPEPENAEQGVFYHHADFLLHRISTVASLLSLLVIKYLLRQGIAVLITSPRV